jgi:hypothetical protein
MVTQLWFSGTGVRQNIMEERRERAEMLPSWWPRSRETEKEGAGDKVYLSRACLQ